MTSDEEAEVAVGLAHGLPTAWGAFYDAYSAPLWRWVSRRVGTSSADVADVVQETFLAAARSARQYTPERGSLWVWLLGIARNHLALHFRNSQRFAPSRQVECLKAAGDGRLTRWLDGSDESPLQAIESAELAALVRLVLTRLPEEYELLLSARYLDDISVHELAMQQSTSVVALRSKLARARQAFRDALAGMSDEILNTVANYQQTGNSAT